MDGVLLPPSMLSEVLQSSLVNDSLTLRPISQVGVGCLTAFCLVAKNRFTLVTSVLRRLIVRSWEEETLGLREGLGFGELDARGWNQRLFGSSLGLGASAEGGMCHSGNLPSVLTQLSKLLV